MIDLASEIFSDDDIMVDVTYISRVTGEHKALKAVIPIDGYERGAEAGKGLDRSIRSTTANHRRFRFKKVDFTTFQPSVKDSIIDEAGVEFRVDNIQLSHAGSIQVTANANIAYRGIPAGQLKV